MSIVFPHLSVRCQTILHRNWQDVGQILGTVVSIISEKGIFIYNVGGDSNIYHTT
jgi:hypothetical protein